MKKTVNKILLPLVLGALLSACQQEKEAKATSVYTSLSGSACQQRTLEAETGSTADRCPGTANYQLDVLYDDNRMSLDVITPDQKSHPLNLWDVLPSGSSALTGNAEWRVKNEVPSALIVRLDTTDQSNIDNPVRSSYLLIGKITPARICIVDKIDTRQQEAAKAAISLADSAADKPCLATE